MSDFNFTPNPYAAPAPGDMPTVSGTLPRGGRPGWYTFYSVVAIILGALGVMNAITGAIGLFFTNTFQSAFNPPPDPNVKPEFSEMLKTMQNEIQGVNDRFFMWFLIAQALLLVVALVLLIGGIQSLQMKRWGVKLLSAGFLLASIFDLGRLILSSFHFMETWQAFEKHFGPLMRESQPQNAPPVPAESLEVLSTIMSASFGVGMCFMVGWSLVKIGFYLSGWFYFQKPQVQALLSD